MNTTTATTPLYEDDYVAWLDMTLDQLKNYDIQQLDWENLTEEIAALGSEQRHKVESYALRLLIHLLLYSGHIWVVNCPLPKSFTHKGFGI